jgi:hypothetical protein
MTQPRRKTTAADRASKIRAFLLNEIPGSTSAAGAHRDAMILARVEASFPGAVVAFGRSALLALTRSLEGGTCSWCAASLIAAGQEPRPDPTNPAMQQLLGTPCRRCSVRHEMGKVAQRERSHLEQITAAGLRPAAAARARTPQQVAALAAAVKKTERARPPVAPTGFLWVAGKEPAGLVASARAARRGRTARRAR